MTKWLYVVIVWLAFSAAAGGQAVRDSVPELQAINVEEHLGDTVPFDLTFIDDGGKEARLGDYFGQGMPVVLILGYYECPMLCNLVFNGVTDAIRDLDIRPGRDYRIITVSINPAETHELAAAKKRNYIDALGDPGAAGGWSFLVGSEEQSKRLADAVGFKYYWDAKREQYAHPAVVMMISEEGTVTRYLYGIQFDPRDFRLALLEASEGKIGNTIDKLILYCYHYDPDADGYVIAAGNVMRLGGAVTMVILAAFIGWLWYRERRRRAAGSPVMSGSN